MARFWSSQTWVIPTFSPTIALVATSRVFPERAPRDPRACQRSARLSRAERSTVSTRGPRPMAGGSSTSVGVAAPRGRRASQNLARRDRLHHRRIAPPGGSEDPSLPLAAAPTLGPGRSGGLDLDLDVDARRQVA